MEKKDPNFDIHDYIDLSGIDDPEKHRIIEETLQGFADAPLLDGQALLRESAERQGEKIKITAHNNEGSIHLHSNININFQQIILAGYHTNPSLAKLTHDNFETFKITGEETSANLTLPEVLWHELEHARAESSLIKEAKSFFKRTEFENDFIDFMNNSSLDSEGINKILSPIPTKTFNNAVEFGRMPIEELREIFNLQDTETPEDFLEFLNYSFKAKLINDSLYETPTIEATNENFRKPLGIPYRLSHLGTLPDEKGTIESFPEMRQRLFDEKLPDLELYYQDEKVTKDFTLNDIEAQQSLPANLPSTPSRERE